MSPHVFLLETWRLGRFGKRREEVWESHQACQVSIIRPRSTTTHSFNGQKRIPVVVVVPLEFFILRAPVVVGCRAFAHRFPTSKVNRDWTAAMGVAKRKPAVWIKDELAGISWIGHEIGDWSSKVLLRVDLVHTPTLNHIVSFSAIVGEHSLHSGGEGERYQLMLSDQSGLHLLIFFLERFNNREEDLFTLTISLNTDLGLTSSRLTISGTEVDMMIDQIFVVRRLRVEE
jgi:hypothetical protein